MKVYPIHDRVLVSFDQFERTFGDSDLIRPDIAFDKPIWGTVRGVGPGKINKRGNRIPMTLKPGDRVLVPFAKGHEMSIDGRLFAFVSEYADNDILAVEE